MPWGVAVVAGAAVVGSALSANSQEQGAAQAANVQEQSTQAANNTQLTMFQSEQTDLAPYMAMGENAGNAVSKLLGLGSVITGSGAKGQVTAADITKQSDAAIAKIQSQPTPTVKDNSRSTLSVLADPAGIFSGLAKGGSTPTRPYMVGEQGPEILHNKYGAHVVGQNGPEIIYPTTEGFIQPNPATAATNKTAAKNWLAGAKMSPIHRAFGGDISGLMIRNPAGNNTAKTGGTTGNTSGLATHPLAGAMGAVSPDLAAGIIPGQHATQFSSSSGYTSTQQALAAQKSPSPAPTHPPTPAGANAPPAPGSTNNANASSGNTAQTQADDLLGQGLGAGYDASTADTAAGQVLQQSPQYQFALQQGIEGLDSSAAASGGLLSGGHLAAILNYSQGLASQQYNNVYNQLMGVTSMGEAAAAGQATNAAVTGAGVSNNESELGSNLANAAYYQGNTQANMYQQMESSVGSAYGMYQGQNNFNTYMNYLNNNSLSNNAMGGNPMDLVGSGIY